MSSVAVAAYSRFTQDWVINSQYNTVNFTTVKGLADGAFPLLAKIVATDGFLERSSHCLQLYIH